MIKLLRQTQNMNREELQEWYISLTDDEREQVAREMQVVIGAVPVITVAMQPVMEALTAALIEFGKVAGDVFSRLNKQLEDESKSGSGQ